MTSRELAIRAAVAADEKKALDVVILDMRESLGVTDYFVIASGKNERQVRKISEAVEESLQNLGTKPAHREGTIFSRWVLLDYIDFVIHIFLDEDRRFYDLERLWKDVPVVEWESSL
ncbi:MAG: ribosome silencing factor [Actinomycetota bacterium]|nr:ribosome silencing factor [Actinomycetota bacterium]